MDAAVERPNKGSSFRGYDHDVCISSSDPDDAVTRSISEALVNAGSRVCRNKDDQGHTQQKSNNAIKRSKIALVLLTKNYVSSTWCLDELVMIFHYKKRFGHKFFLLSFDVDLSEVVDQKFAWVQNDQKSKIQGWKKALREALEYAGLGRKHADDLLDSSSINEIIRVIQNKLKKDGSKVLSGTINGYLDRAADIGKIEGAGDAVGLRQNQEGEGLSSKETLENPSFHESIKSFLQCIPNMKDIPPKDRYPSGVLDLSNRSIKSLPKTISSLVELRELWLRGDRLLAELPSEIGALKNLKVLDLEGTELICLPKEIGELLQLECLKVSLYRCADNYIKETGAIIPRGALSKLSCLKELSINVDPDCKWWKEVAEAIITELPKLRNLKILKFYFPEDELLQQFLQHAENVFRSLSNFRLIVGRHEADIVFRLPNELQSEFEKSEKCLKYVNGVGKTDGIGKALEHAKALFLDRHWDIKKLSEFNIHEMRLLVCCLVLECNEMETIIDGSDFYQEGDNNNIDKEPVLKLLRYLSVHHMKNLQCIWKGPIVTGCLSGLEILVLHTCPELITVFDPELLRNLRNLKKLIVKNCPKIKSLVTVEPRPLQSANDDFLPNLRNILLFHLPGLLLISSGLIIRPNLQKIVVHNCPNLTPEDKYRNYIHKINHDSKWSEALDSSNNETDYLRSILEDQLKNSENSRQAARTEGTVGVKDKIEKGVAPYQRGMDGPTNTATIVSICGMAGIGKTTIASSVYNSNYDKFEGSCFLSNIRQYSRKPNGLVRLQEQLLSSIPPKEKVEKKTYDVNEGMLIIQNAIWGKRVLVVLDDVDDLSQLQALIGKRDWYCPGSKIIITTENQQLLKGYEDHKLYVVESLNDDESLRLFSLHAFGREHPNTNYVDLSMKLVKHCDGIPLALVVLGSSLYGSSQSEYESANDKMELIPQTRQLERLLNMSFQSLPDQHDKDLFLHIACFFVGKDRDYVIAILDGCGFQTATGIRTLEDRCLLTIDRDNKLRMHQLLQDMGREIVLQEESAGKRHRVWQHEDALDVLRERAGGDKIEGLILEFPTAKEPLIYETDAFSRMEKLRLLQLNNVQLNGGYEEFPKDLVWFCWLRFPLSSLPTDFPMEKLVMLDVRYSSLKQVWEKTKFLSSLKILNLSHSHELTCAPDFSTLPKLESLILKDCVNLLEVHESIADLERLCLLNLKGCINLRRLPRLIFHLRSLETLVLSGCSELLKQSEMLGELESSKKRNSELYIYV
ncbi:hypothetical protein LguiA_026510 [Lonicera macranthoides]